MRPRLAAHAFPPQDARQDTAQIQQQVDANIRHSLDEKCPDRGSRTVIPLARHAYPNADAPACSAGGFQRGRLLSHAPLRPCDRTERCQGTVLGEDAAPVSAPPPRTERLSSLDGSGGLHG